MDTRTFGRIIRQGFAALSLLAFSTLPPAHAQGQSFALEAIVNGQRHALPVAHFDEKQSIQYISISRLARVLGLDTYYSNQSTRAILYLGKTEVKINAFNPFVAIGDKLYQLPVETWFADGEIYVPLPHFLNLIRPHFKGRLTVLKNYTPAAQPPVRASRTPELADPEDNSEAAATPTRNDARPVITDVTVEKKANGTLIRIQLDREFDASHVNSRITNGWLYVDIYGGNLAPSLAAKSENSGVVRKFTPVQLPQSAQLSFKLRGEINSRKVYANTDAHEILVSLTTEERIPANILKTLEDERKKWLIDTIIIDPGHGGRDPGAIGPGKVYEKDVVLKIGLKLRDLLRENSDMRVIMTREDDRFIPLRNRTKLANQDRGKLFISIHANSNRNPRVAGLTTYFLGPAKTEEALEVSRRENSVINYENEVDSYAGFDTEGFILLSLAQNAYLQESQELAALVQEEVSRAAKIRNRGVKQAGYYVLIGASMPNILVEVAFISNKREAKMLKNDKFQSRIAAGIYKSVLRFKQKYEAGI